MLFENSQFAGLFTDSAFRLRLARRFRADGSIEWLERQKDGAWVPFLTVPISDIERDDASPEYAIYDHKTRRFRTLAKVRRQLEGLPLQPLQPVVFPARDGLTLRGYLTLPHADARHRPLVLVIHGGPYARDAWGFIGTHQWLANRGYAVLSVNFRGSTGFGKAFVTAADREWGGKMHDDLIDAVDWAVTRGIADPQRGGAAEPIDRARDFKGSTLAVEVGAELVPGLSG